jgi:hypothetical protein
VEQLPASLGVQTARKAEKGRYPSACADFILGVGAFRAMQLARTISMAAACGFCYDAGVDTNWPPGPSPPSTHYSDLLNVSLPTHLHRKIHPHPLSHPPPLSPKASAARWPRKNLGGVLEPLSGRRSSQTRATGRSVMPLSGAACKDLFSVAPASLC